VFVGEVVSNASAVVENASFLLSFDRYYHPYEVPQWLYIYGNLHGFARFPGDSTALVGSWYEDKHKQ